MGDLVKVHEMYIDGELCWADGAGGAWRIRSLAEESHRLWAAEADAQTAAEDAARENAEAMMPTDDEQRDAEHMAAMDARDAETLSARRAAAPASKEEIERYDAARKAHPYRAPEMFGPDPRGNVKVLADRAAEQEAVDANGQEIDRMFAVLDDKIESANVIYEAEETAKRATEARNAETPSVDDHSEAERAAYMEGRQKRREENAAARKAVKVTDDGYWDDGFGFGWATRELAEQAHKQKKNFTGPTESRNAEILAAIRKADQETADAINAQKDEAMERDMATVLGIKVTDGVRPFDLMNLDSHPIDTIYRLDRPDEIIGIGVYGYTKIMPYLEHDGNLWLAVFQGEFLERRLPAQGTCIVYRHPPKLNQADKPKDK